MKEASSTVAILSKSSISMDALCPLFLRVHHLVFSHPVMSVEVISNGCRSCLMGSRGAQGLIRSKRLQVCVYDQSVKERESEGQINRLVPLSGARGMMGVR